MAWGPLTGFQIAKDLSNNASLITTPAFFTGDFRMLTVSVSTQSNAAINVQSHNGDGFQAPLNEAEWRNVLPISVQSVFALTTIPRWSRTSSPAASNATIIFAGRS